MAVKIKFISEKAVNEGESLLMAAKDAHIKLKDSCDGKGKCGKCLVKVVSGNVSQPTKKEIKELGIDKIDEGYRLACQTDVIDGEAVIEIVN